MQAAGTGRAGRRQMGLAAWWQRRGDRRVLRRSQPATGFRLEPEPWALGQFARGRQIAAGSFHLAGALVETHEPWQVSPPGPAFAAALQGWGWLDHLAAFGDPAARSEARRWLDGWIAAPLDGPGAGALPAWAPDLAGRRLLRWVIHARFLTAGAHPQAQGRFLAALGAHVGFLAHAAGRARPGLPRIEALTGWLIGALTLGGCEDQVPPALAALTEAAAALIAEDGAIPARNPEALLEVFVHLVWAQAALGAAEAPVPAPLEAALARATRAIRALRHADGALARFHGGGSGPEGLADRALAAAGPALRARPAAAMGFARLEGGRTTLIVDAAPPPAGAAATVAHASTLAFELTSGRRPLIVSSGPGQGFGADWALAARATSSHSTLALDGVSSARIAAGAGLRAGVRGRADPAAMVAGPRRVTLHRSDERDAATLLLSHDGWVETHGLTHSRSLQLSADGRSLLASDELAALAPADQARLAQVLSGLGGRGLGFALRFHLHPEADPSVDMQGRAVSVGLPSGEVWVFRFEATQGGPVSLALEPSVWLEPDRRAPRPCRQIVLRGALRDPGLRINWTLAKGQDTPLAIRDIEAQQGDALPADFFDRD